MGKNTLILIHYNVIQKHLLIHTNLLRIIIAIDFRI